MPINTSLINACYVICSMQKYRFRKWPKTKRRRSFDLCLKDSFFFMKNVDVCNSMNTPITAISTKVTIQLPNIDMIS